MKLVFSEREDRVTFVPESGKDCGRMRRISRVAKVGDPVIYAGVLSTDFRGVRLRSLHFNFGGSQHVYNVPGRRTRVNRPLGGIAFSVSATEETHDALVSFRGGLFYDSAQLTVAAIQRVEGRIRLVVAITGKKPYRASMAAAILTPH